MQCAEWNLGSCGIEYDRQACTVGLVESAAAALALMPLVMTCLLVCLRNEVAD